MLNCSQYLDFSALNTFHVVVGPDSDFDSEMGVPGGFRAVEEGTHVFQSHSAL